MTRHSFTVAVFSLLATAAIQLPLHASELELVRQLETRFGVDVSIDESTRHVNYVKLFGSGAADDVLLQLSAFPELAVLYVSPDRREGATDTGVAALGGLNLRCLDLRGTNVTDASAPTIGKMTDLTQLHLGSHVTGAALPFFHELKKLELLHLASSRINDASVSRLLPHLPRLTHLVLWGTNISNEVIGRPSDVAKLQLLHLQETRVNEGLFSRLYAPINDSLEACSAPTELDKLLLPESTVITPKGAKELARVLGVSKLTLSEVVQAHHLVIPPAELPRLAEADDFARKMRKVRGIVEFDGSYSPIAVLFARAEGGFDATKLNCLPETIERLGFPNRTDLSGSDLKYLYGLSKLAKINIRGCDRLFASDDAVAQFANLLSLTDLEITNVIGLDMDHPVVSGRLLSADIVARRLRALGAYTWFEGTKIDGSDLHIHGIDFNPSLVNESAADIAIRMKSVHEILSLTGSPFVAKEVKQLGIHNATLLAVQQIPKLFPNVNDLYLEGSGITDDTIAWVAANLKLKELDLENTSLSREGPNLPPGAPALQIGALSGFVGTVRLNDRDLEISTTEFRIPGCGVTLNPADLAKVYQTNYRFLLEYIPRNDKNPAKILTIAQSPYDRWLSFSTHRAATAVAPPLEKPPFVLH